MGGQRRARAYGSSAFVGNGAGTTLAQLNRQICAAAEQGDVRKIFQIVECKLDDMNYVNLCTTLHRLGKMVKESGEVFEAKQDMLVRALIKQVKGTLHYISSTPNADPQPQCLSTIAWSAARLQIEDAEVMQMIGDIALHCLPRFKHFELANLLWGFAKLRITHNNLFHEAHAYVLRSADRFTIGSLSTIAWAYATIQFQPCWRLLCKIVDTVSENFGTSDDASPVSIANLVWALATAGVHARRGPLLSIANAALASLQSFKAHELAITLWAFAHLAVFHEDLFFQAAKHFAQTIKLQNEVHVQGIANLLWALAKRKVASHDQAFLHVSGNVLPQLLLTCERLLPQAGQVEATAILWSVSQLAGFYGNQPIADRIWVMLATQQGTDDFFFYGFSAASAERIRSSYAKFFGTQLCAPAACQAFMTRLDHFCKGTRCDVISSDIAAYSYGDDGEETHLSSSFSYGTVKVSDDSCAEPLRIHSCSFVSPEAMSEQWSGILTDPAYVVLDMKRLCCGDGGAFLCPAVASVPAAIEPPALSIMLECMDMDANEEDQQTPVILVFAVATHAAFSVVGIRADISGGGVPPAVEDFQVNACSDCEGIYSLALPPRLGTWAVSLCATELSTGMESSSVNVSFVGRRVEAPTVLEGASSSIEPSKRCTRSSCAGSEGSTYAESDASEPTP